MDRLKAALFFFALTLHCLSEASLPEIVGDWKLISMLHQGQPIPLPNPDLNLHLTFFANGTERLYWDRGTPLFCEGFAHYQYDGGYLKQAVFAVNPKNSPDCTRDVDLQLGRSTQTKLDFAGKNLRLAMPMGDEELIYVFQQGMGP